MCKYNANTSNDRHEILVLETWENELRDPMHWFPQDIYPQLLPSTLKVDIYTMYVGYMIMTYHGYKSLLVAVCVPFEYIHSQSMCVSSHPMVDLTIHTLFTIK